VEGGAPLAATRITRWGTPETGEIVGVMPDSVKGRKSGAPIDATVHLGRRTHVYQLKAGRYLGNLEAVEAKFAPERLEFFALWPHRIGPPALALSTTEPRPGKRVTATIRFADAAKGDVQVVMLTEVSPGGQTVDWWRREVVVKGGTAEVPLYVAHDEEPGTWTLRVQDTISGQTAEAKFAVAGTDTAQAPWPRVAK
jgi:hypothetical protein